MALNYNEVRQRFGLVPNFFRLAPEQPGITEGLWQFARLGYLDNPFPSLFKERLFVWLSRFCEVRYCIARHVGFLLGLGHASGDPGAPPVSVADVLRLLSHPVPHDAQLRRHAARLAALDQPLDDMPLPDTELEWPVFCCATHVFLHGSAQPDCLAALRHALGPLRAEQLLLLLCFTRTAHYWTKVHPELVLEEDIRDLLGHNDELRAWVLGTGPPNAGAGAQPLLEQLDALRHEKQQLLADQELRLQQDLADSRLLHEISIELVGEQDIDALYGELVDAAARLMRSSFASMQILRDRDGQPELQMLASRGLPADAVAYWRQIDANTPSSCAAALRCGHRVVIPDITRSHHLVGADLSMYRKVGIRASQSTPLQSRTGVLVGMLSTHWREPHWPSEHSLQMLDILARQAADLIERAKGEETLRARDQRFRQALQPENVGVIFFDLAGRITEANDAFLRQSGYDRADLEAGRLRWDEMTPPEWMQSSRKALEEFHTKGYMTAYEKECTRKDGTRWWGLFAATRLGDDEGVEYIIDITDRKLAEQALKDADRRKDEFLATLAHELRNPLAPISNVVGLLQRRDGRRSADRLMEIVGRQVRQMVRLVDDLLEMSRITSGKIVLNKAPVALAAIVEEAIETSRPLIEQGRHTLTVSLPLEPAVLDADSVRLTQVLSNLLNNAAKYTNPGGRIWVRAWREGGGLAIAVVDNGIGIAPEQLPQMFDLFAQAEPTGRHGQGGLGIGLTMARTLVEMHGGTIEAHSAGLGHGSEVMVRLPLCAAAADGRAVLPAPNGAAPLSGKRILVVDDNHDAADTLGLLLQADGADVRMAYDGQAVPGMMDTFAPQVVLLDLGMPGMDGFEVAQRLRRDPRHAGLRIVALTGWGQESDRHQTRAAGFDSHMTKPVDIGALEEWLQQA